MAIERKQFQEKVEKKKTDKIEGKKLRKGVNLALLPDAIVDGKAVFEIGSEIVVSRFRNGKKSFSICTVKKIDTAGLIETWDESVQQWYVFPLAQPPEILKLLK